MEEILASIRRIISDDESNSTPQPATSSDYARQHAAEESEDGAADTQIIDDITRVLSGGAQPAGGDDDILDLAEAGAPAAEPMADMPEPMAAMPSDADMPESAMPADAEMPEPMAEMSADTEFVVGEEVVLGESPTEPDVDFSAAFPPAGTYMNEPPVVVEVATVFEEFEDSVVVEAADSPEPYGIPERDMGEVSPAMDETPASDFPPVSASGSLSQDPTSALERAIAALKAGDLAAFAREAQADYAPAEPVPNLDLEPEFEAPPPESLVAEFPGAELEAEALELELEELVPDEPVPELSASAAPAESPTWAESETESEPETKPEPESESTTDWQSAASSWGTGETEPEAEPARINGGSAHKSHDFESPVSSKSLEDSVKEMLRPLLRQWLDENMPRVLNAALREELENVERRND
ncbi:MAG: DUF2497 domain-containing protein, partial [Methyloceanibacter sp.]